MSFADFAVRVAFRRRSLGRERGARPLWLRRDVRPLRLLAVASVLCGRDSALPSEVRSGLTDSDTARPLPGAGLTADEAAKIKRTGTI